MDVGDKKIHILLRNMLIEEINKHEEEAKSSAKTNRKIFGELMKLYGFKRC